MLCTDIPPWDRPDEFKTKPEGISAFRGLNAELYRIGLKLS